jgi:hypothetical protein
MRHCTPVALLRGRGKTFARGLDLLMSASMTGPPTAPAGGLASTNRIRKVPRYRFRSSRNIIDLLQNMKASATMPCSVERGVNYKQVFFLCKQVISDLALLYKPFFGVGKL